MIVNLIKVLPKFNTIISLLLNAAQVKPHVKYKQRECCFECFLQVKHCKQKKEVYRMLQTTSMTSSNPHQTPKPKLLDSD
ncbi:ubiquinol-cytochrome C chaperone family protein [Trifolium repens]|nr:ubiquinol-cytochrome C chaperone family protein [Trifolium repens]